MTVCTRPPKGWEPCRRTPGHNGTCSPYPDVRTPEKRVPPPRRWQRPSKFDVALFAVAVSVYALCFYWAFIR